MRKKEAVAAVCIMAFCIVTACGLYLYQRAQIQRELDAHNAKLAQIATPHPGEDILIDDPEDTYFTGSLSIRILDAVLYDDANAAGQAEGFDSSEVGQELFTDQMKRDDPISVLAFHVSVKNIDATPAKGISRSGASLFSMGALAYPNPGNDPLYLVGGEQGPDRGYFSLDCGQEKTFAVVYGVRKADADANSFTISDIVGPTYRTSLTATDKREERP
ncbi:hypothetical protein [uncultured Parolsenella sp.]|uniref:hypothetical protein n=1 Tax=uncultured Parolsenella sp. TaxID=2083008 RepID=UPI0027DB8357|nr:hypothetical protein [uncultured Parolsenella sp.]